MKATLTDSDSIELPPGLMNRVERIALALRTTPTELINRIVKRALVNGVHPPQPASRDEFQETEYP